MSRNEPPRIAILGAGPVGVEAALYAASLGLPFRVYERDKVGDYLRQWGHVRLFTPFAMNSTPLGRAALKADPAHRDLPGDGDILTGREHLAAYLEPLAGCPALAGHVETGTTVLAVGRRGYLKEEGLGDARRAAQPFRLLLRDAAGKERTAEADIVLDCTGTYGRPRHLGDGGIPAVGELAATGIARGLEDVLGERRKHYADHTVLVVGGGHSAATSVCLLARLAQEAPSTWIIWLARGAGSQPIRRVMSDPLRERDQLAARANMLATRGEGHVEFHPQSIVQSIEPHSPDSFTVRAQCGREQRSWQVERIIANVGYDPDNSLYRELQVHECYASLGPMNLAAALQRHAGADCLAIGSQGPATLRNPEPNFYVLGSKSYGRTPNFLLRTGFEQVREVFTLIAGKADLDLYKKARA
jgi:thioredoxin reductase